MSLAQARLDEGQVVVVAVGVPQASEHGRPVGASAEPGAVAGRIGLGREPKPPLLSPGVERRIDVDQRERLVGKLRQELEVVAEVDPLFEHRRDSGPNRTFVRYRRPEVAQSETRT